MMISASDIVRLARVYSDAKAVPLSAVSSRVFNDGKKIAQMIDKDADLTLKRATHAVTWFSEHWPAEVAWPSDVPRPSSSDERAA